MNDQEKNKDNEACCGGNTSQECACGHDHDHDHDHEHGHDHDHDHDHASAQVTMVDQETGEEFTFEMVDSMELDGETYCLLATVADEPEALFVRVVTMEDGTEGLMSLEDEEFDRVSAAYDSLLDETDEDDLDDEEDN